MDREYTYHVDRGKFDLMLLQHAHKLGATVYEGVKVSSVDFDVKEPVVRFNMGRNGKEMGLSAKMVVDASGRNTFLGNQLKLKDQRSCVRSVRNSHLYGELLGAEPRGFELHAAPLLRPRLLRRLRSLLRLSSPPSMAA